MPEEVRMMQNRAGGNEPANDAEMNNAMKRMMAKYLMAKPAKPGHGAY
jgi:hypothetical protein